MMTFPSFDRANSACPEAGAVREERAATHVPRHLSRSGG